jgi:hypothetical protein
MEKAELIELAEALEEIGYEIVLEDRIAESPFGKAEPVKRYKRLTVTIQKAEAREASASELREFMKKCVSLEPDSLTGIRIAYERYLDYFGFSDKDVESGGVLTRRQFIRLVLKEYEGKLTDTVELLEGRPTRCFSGMRLIDKPSCMPQEGGTVTGD